MALKYNLWKEYAILVFPWTGFLTGKVLNKWEDERLSRFRDKSALYGKAVPPEKPSCTCHNSKFSFDNILIG
uniref:NADH dehydrogenase [ubiquinone] 1 beta subcomplex subunit 1 n=1 Tax=Trichogramma kaykai TaxID=54128 RepID=A0ABD2WSE0_9HYME